MTDLHDAITGADCSRRVSLTANRTSVVTVMMSLILNIKQLLESTQENVCGPLTTLLKENLLIVKLKVKSKFRKRHKNCTTTGSIGERWRSILF